MSSSRKRSRATEVTIGNGIPDSFMELFDEKDGTFYHSGLINHCFFFTSIPSSNRANLNTSISSTSTTLVVTNNTNADSSSSSSSSSKASKSRSFVPPGFMNYFIPTIDLRILYHSGFLVDYGTDKEDREGLAKAPHVEIFPTPAWTAKYGSSSSSSSTAYSKSVKNEEIYFTLLFVDPDAPKPSEPLNRSEVKWLITDIPYSAVCMGARKSKVEELGSTVIRYSTPYPADSTHRFVFLLCQQPSGRKVSVSVTLPSVTSAKAVKEEPSEENDEVSTKKSKKTKGGNTGDKEPILLTSSYLSTVPPKVGFSVPDFLEQNHLIPVGINFFIYNKDA